ncbi:transcription factor TGAL3-like isoform X2 [Oryza sativa Japonica Group]|uniref:transcription factor TGAL3-like isoform X2 n=1 Tax=Oryza sativa subsp. japonica TaxID=39947 RepID=UPI000E1BE931|nr:transcription factor TGAL3-like isoform X2 [Oryza sativa Japonica Group]
MNPQYSYPCYKARLQAYAAVAVAIVLHLRRRRRRRRPRRLQSLLPPPSPPMHHHPSHVFTTSCRAEEQQLGGIGTAGYHIGDGAIFPPHHLLPPPDLPLLRTSPNPSSKSSSNLTAGGHLPPLAVAAAAAAAHGVAVVGMAAHQGMAAATAADRFCLPRMAAAAAAASQVENWGDSGVIVSSPFTDDTSTDLDDSADKHHLHALVGGGDGGDDAGEQRGADSSAVSKERRGDQKMQRRLAQNREAARKSRMRKKAYIQQLESSRSKLMHLEQELQRARQQGIFIATGGSGDHGHSIGGNGTLAFDLEYARWLDEHQRHINDLRVALNAQMSDDELCELVDAVMMHYDQVFRLKSFATKSDVFHVLSGMWMSPAERFFMWLGGFRSSELLKVLASHLEPLTDQQLMGICNLQQSSQQAEDALSQGMEALQQTLGDTLVSAAATVVSGGGGADNVTNYMGQMAIAMAKLTTLENFLRQADLLRHQTLQQMHRILTTRQAARALLVISDYFSRLRALSSLWLARPRD